MAVQDILLKVGVEATVGPVLSSVLGGALQKHRLRKRCSSYYLLLIHGPVAIRDEIARLGEEEGCWTSSFVETFRKANGIAVVDRKTPDELVEKALERTVPAAVNYVDDDVASAVKELSKDLLKATVED